MLLADTVEEEEKALRPIPKSYFVAVFVAGGLTAVGLAAMFYLAEQRQPEAEPAPEAAATATGGELDPAVQRELETLEDEPGPSWLDSADDPPAD